MLLPEPKPKRSSTRLVSKALRINQLINKYGYGYASEFECDIYSYEKLLDLKRRYRYDEDGAAMAAIYGTAVRSDGSKVNGTMRVSTSWNGNEAFPRDGRYRLDLGSNPRQRITVYVDGMTYAEIFVDGDTPLDIRTR